MKYYKRAVKQKVEKLQSGFPVISVTGPRQSGKTTFLKENYPDYSYFNLEDPVVLERIKDDPKSFLRENPEELIVDEIQRYPELLSFLQVHVDNTQVMGKIFISGSQNLLITEKISQSLAGRAGYQSVLPFSLEELKANSILNDNVYSQILKGGYPGLYSRDIDSTIFFRQYISTYAERDVRQLKNIQDLTRFQRFLGLLAGRVGQVLNVSSLASDIGISPNTAEDWISILEASYLVFRLQPFFNNVGKRLIKSPKVYFYDTGLLCALLNINNEVELKNHYSYGNIFENFIVNEFVKFFENDNVLGQIYFFRDQHGNEIDLLLDLGLNKIPIEIKSSSSYSSTFRKGLKYWRDYVDSDSSGYIVYSGSEQTNIRGDMLVPWLSLDRIFRDIEERE